MKVSHRGQVLSGQGGGELFCGYPRYQVFHATAGLDRWPLAPRRLIARLATHFPGVRESRFGADLRRARRVLTQLAEVGWREVLILCMISAKPRGSSCQTLPKRSSRHLPWLRTLRR